jgi:pimeloyl-ACP methyl ester carboxylesterase
LTSQKAFFPPGWLYKNDLSSFLATTKTCRMAKSKRLLKSFLRLLLPIVVLSILALVPASIWLVYATSRPNNVVYLVTPQKYGQLSARAAQVTEESWTNNDGTKARGWLLRGEPGMPGVILLHKYGADRSYTLNLGVKLSEGTNFTVLMPDERGHGENPLVPFTSFGGSEADDVSAAIKFLQNLKAPDQGTLVGQDLGLYGVEMGALAALSASAANTNIKMLVLDSMPQDSDAVLQSVVEKRFPFASSVTSSIAKLGTKMYYFDGSYQRTPPCEQARSIFDRKVLLLAGTDAPAYQDSTSKLSKCFPAGSSTETKTDLSPSGYSIVNSSIEQADAYDQRVIDFFRQASGH